MDPTIEQALQLFGVSVAQLATVSGVTYLIIEVLKGKFSHFFNDRVTDVSAVIVGFIVAGQSLHWDWLQWQSMVVMTLAAWLLPAGFHKARKNGKN